MPQEYAPTSASVQAPTRSHREDGISHVVYMLGSALAHRDYDRFGELLAQSGAELHFLPPHGDTGLDSIYTHDPAVVSNNGVVLGNMGKAERSGEPRALGEFCRSHDRAILGYHRL